MHRLIHFRLTLAVTGGVALALGVWLDLDWLAASGLAASAAAEALGQAAVRVAVNTPNLRLAQAAAETLPSVGMAVVLPEALLVAAAVVVRPLVCGAMETVVISRGLEFPQGAGATRRTVTSGANFLLVIATLAALGLLAIRPDWAHVAVWGAVVAACLASAGAIIRDGLVMRGR
jgi:hypothetical protein